MIEVALGIILAVILLTTIDWWFMPVAKILGFIFMLAIVGIFITFVAILSGG